MELKIDIVFTYYFAIFNLSSKCLFSFDVKGCHFHWHDCPVEIRYINKHLTGTATNDASSDLPYASEEASRSF